MGTSVTRRAALVGLGALSAAAVAPAVARIKAAEERPTSTGVVPSAQERCDFHLAEYKRACEELDPMIGHWSLHRSDDVLVLSAFRLTGRYEGDGLYETGRENVLGKRDQLRVRLLAERVDGHRLFEVTYPGERAQLTEPVLQITVGRRIA